MRRALALCLVLAACGPSTSNLDTGLDALEIDRVDPGLIVPGSQIAVTGMSFVDVDLGTSRLVFDGAVGPTPVHFSLIASFVSATRLSLPVDQAFITAVGGQLTGSLQGTFTVEVLSTVDMAVHRATPVTTSLDMATQPTPSLTSVTTGPAYVNQPLALTGDQFLLGGNEGTTSAHLIGCFTPDGASMCDPPIDLVIPATPLSEFDRAHAAFPYITAISGIGPGQFTGTVTVQNDLASGMELTAPPVDISLTIQRPTITGSSTTGASLGEYVMITGGGFVGGASSTDESTVLELVGTYTDQNNKVTPLDVVLVPDVIDGLNLRYVMDETDALGTTIDLRKSYGTIVGTLQVTVQKGSVKLEGDPIPVTLQILQIKQVLYVNFLASYLSSLRHFGLRAADALIHERVLILSQQIYDTLNMDIRDQVVTDFALFSIVDIAGPDPNNEGNFGYDNTPGKDVGNLRLYDHIGGANALTESDGSAGFGGVFTEEFFSFSAHPNGLAMGGVPDPMFDAIFDPFRPDAGGRELTSTELAALNPAKLTDGSGCPAASGDRSGQVSCAIWTLGNIIASTMVHEVGHSLGLADPFGSATSYHNVGDLPNRLMEVGGARPFSERAILGEGPAQFCTDEYTYLRDILANAQPVNQVMRQPCD